VHELPSLQVVPESGVCVQPVVALQASVVQALPSSQLSAVPAAQVPFWQSSAPSQMVLLGHGVPLETFVCVQPEAVLQVSLVQGLPSSQLGAVPGWQTPAWQVSAPLQALPSEHEVPVSGACWHPSWVSQLSVVQTLLSLQSAALVQGTQPLMGVPVQVPPWQ
jgi:hypothetical protein